MNDSGQLIEKTPKITDSRDKLATRINQQLRKETAVINIGMNDGGQ
jgi:hypothetical protein